jgi:hypothetical protein
MAKRSRNEQAARERIAQMRAEQARRRRRIRLPATGRVVALYDGKVYQGSPRDIPLTAHAQIQLDIGTPLIAPQPVTFPAGL